MRRPYQIEAAKHLRTRRATMLVADPGMGKSVVALDAFADLDRVLIVCNAAAMVSWPLLAQEWDTSGRPFVTVDDGRDFDWSAFGSDFPATICVNYDLLGIRANNALRQALRDWSPQAVVIDECQYVRSPGANRTQAVFGRGCVGKKCLVEGADFVAELSGTPMPNHAGELWTHYRALWTEFWSDVNGGKPLTSAEWETIYTKFRDTKFGRSITGSKNIAELRRRLDPVILRLKKEDHLADLPPLDFHDAPISADASAIAAICAGLPVTVGMDDDEIVETLAAAPVATVRRSLGLAKVAGAVEWAEAKLAEGADKLILFAYHKEVIDRLAEGLVMHNPVVFDGRTSPDARRDAVSRFQGVPSTRVFIGQITAAGTAITLTAAALVGIVEASWTPTENYQAACRAHRIGQRDGVVAFFLSAPGTLDARIAQTFRRKAREIAEMFD